MESLIAAHDALKGKYGEMLQTVKNTKDQIEEVRLEFEKRVKCKTEDCEKTIDNIVNKAIAELEMLRTTWHSAAQQEAQTAWSQTDTVEQRKQDERIVRAAAKFEADVQKLLHGDSMPQLLQSKAKWEEECKRLSSELQELQTKYSTRYAAQFDQSVQSSYVNQCDKIVHEVRTFRQLAVQLVAATTEGQFASSGLRKVVHCALNYWIPQI
jgi:hypothetical protein